LPTKYRASSRLKKQWVSSFLLQWNLLFVAVAMGTGVILFFGPSPQVLTGINFLRDGFTGTQENSDRLVFLYWAALPLVFYLIYSRITNRPSQMGPTIPLDLNYLWTALAISASVLTLLNVVGEAGDSLVFASSWSIALAIPILLVMVISTQNQHPWVHISKTLLLSIAAYLLLPIFLTFVTGPTDTFHASYIYEELLSVSAGNIPYSNFYPQYTALIPFALAPFLSLSGQSATSLLNILLPVMQLGVFSVLVYVAWRYWGRKYAPLLAVIVAIPILNRYVEDDILSTSYVPNFPVRTILPVITLAILLILGPRILSANNSLKEITSKVLLGFTITLSAFNNPDFGLPLGLAIFLVLLVRRSSNFWRIRLTILLLLGCAIALLGITVLYASQNASFNIDSFMFFARAFPGTGLDSEIMQPFGVHVVIATLAIFGIVHGLGTLRSSKHQNNMPRLLRATILVVSSLWTLLTLAYFVNRSLPGTLLAGMGVQTALLAGLLGPQIIKMVSVSIQVGKRGWAHSLNISPMMLSPLILVLAYLGSIFLSPAVLPSLTAYTRGAPLHSFPTEQVETLSSEVASAAGDLLNLNPSTTIRQAVPFSALVSSKSSIQGLGVIADIDAYLPISPTFSDLFCSRLKGENRTMLLVTKETFKFIKGDGLCNGDLSLVKELSGNLVVVKVT